MKRTHRQLILRKITKLSKLTLTTIALFLYSGLLNAQQVPKVANNGMGYLEYLPADYQSTNKKYPAIIFLHGHGERGNGSPSALKAVEKNGPPKLIKNGDKMCFDINGNEECFIVLSPQQGNDRHGWKGYEVIPFVQYALNNYRIDPDRVYLTGLSMGGQGTWETAYSDENEPNYFAALAPVAGRGSFNDACIVAEREIPVWGFHGSKDNAIGVGSGERPINGMNACNAKPEPKFTIYEGVGHSGTWKRAYKTDHSIHSPNLYEWLLSQSKSGGNDNFNPPDAPSHLNGNNTTSSEISIKWRDNSNNENSFEIERSVNRNSGYSIIKTTSDNTTNYKDRNLPADKTYYYRVRAKNNDGTSSYSNKLKAETEKENPIEPSPPSGSTIIIDNNSAKVSTNGNWSNSTAGGNKKYKSNYLHDGNNKKVSKKAIFKTNLESGKYEVFAWWFAHNNRASNTPFEIASSTGTTTIQKNQRNEGSKWVSLGTYEFDSNAKISISNNNTNGYVVVDAIKFVPVSAANPPTSGSAIVLDNNDEGVEDNNWKNSSAGGDSKYGSNYLHDGNSQKGKKDVVYKTSVNPGNYEVFARWFAYRNRATNTHYQIITSSDTHDVYKNQRINDAQWVSLGDYTFGNEAEIIVKNDGTDGFVIADAIKLVPKGSNANKIPNTEGNMKLASSSDITVFPNPVGHILNIKSPFEDIKEFHLKLMGTDGQIEWQKVIEGEGDIAVNLSRANLKKGIKFLRIEVEGQAVKIIRVMVL